MHISSLKVVYTAECVLSASQYCPGVLPSTGQTMDQDLLACRFKLEHRVGCSWLVDCQWLAFFLVHRGMLSSLRVAFVIVCERKISCGRFDNGPDLFRVGTIMVISNWRCGGKTQFSSEFLKESSVGAAATALQREGLIVV